MRRMWVTWCVLLPWLAVSAEAVTVKEIIDLTRAGLSDEVLLALIEVDQRVFSIDAETLKELKAAGVGERVIVAMVRSGRTPPPEPAEALPLSEPEPPPPQVMVIEREPVVQQVPVPILVPVYVPVVQRVRGHHQEPINPAVPFPVMGIGSLPVTQPVSRPEPVYWGWGGKLRPDAWKPSPDPPRPPDK